MRGQQAGFTLFELIAVTVILGIIGVFVGIMISTGASGSLTARIAEENAQKGQIALERISLELRDVNGGPGASNTAPLVTATNIQYTTSQASLSGTRTLAYDSANKRITITPASGGTARTLVDGVNACTMGYGGASGTYNITFTVSFTLTGTATPFSITVKPRNSINTPASS
ncbi:MAG: prepilin-type N-terminal cleavage/methylation domain-containing protein [Desulfovibrio sp.]|jgi:prepilin-type N-terminal cleavage/methylation domain-containing protein|nr:prepilin-type N-terminal cleavage/methylation domain-containing protein [Desulfovibrio sp.]